MPQRLLALVRKELIRPSAGTLPDDEAFRFRHLLIRDAAYDALPKATRADLHERFALWLDEHASLVEQDEIVGYHLEQAARYRQELGSGNDALAAAAAASLERAAHAAHARGDVVAANNLARRAADLLPPGNPQRLGILPYLVRLSSASARFDVAEELIDELEALRPPRSAGLRLALPRGPRDGEGRARGCRGPPLAVRARRSRHLPSSGTSEAWQSPSGRSETRSGWSAAPKPRALRTPACASTPSEPATRRSSTR